MGSEGSKDSSGKKSKVPAKAITKLNDKDYKFLTSKTGLNKEQIDNLFKKFIATNKGGDGQLDRDGFKTLYLSLRTESTEQLEKISKMIFRAFDSDNNNYLTFNEFLIGYALTTRGDAREKLDYAFELFDADNNGYIDSKELKEVIKGMLELLDSKHGNDLNALTQEAFEQLDKSKDGKISKDEFINGLLSSYNLRVLLSPFN